MNPFGRFTLLLAVLIVAVQAKAPVGHRTVPERPAYRPHRPAKRPQKK